MSAFDTLLRFSSAKLAPLRRAPPAGLSRGRKAFMIAALAFGVALVIVWVCALLYWTWRLIALLF